MVVECKGGVLKTFVSGEEVYSKIMTLFDNITIFVFISFRFLFTRVNKLWVNN